MGLLQDRDLLDVLFDLSLRMNTYGGKIENCNVLDRWHHFSVTAERGKDCVYARKYRDMFLDKDYEDVKKLVLEAAEYFNSIDKPLYSKDIPFPPQETDE